jgi:hypothetical protein
MYGERWPIRIFYTFLYFNFNFGQFWHHLIMRMPYISFQKRKASKMCTQNFPDFPKIPTALVGMTEMENHLVAPRITFMKIYTLPRGRQRGVHGGMVNVPTNLTRIQQLLPRQLHSRESITINLNRRVCFKGSYTSTTCRPSQVVSQLQYLCSTELYKIP